MNKQSSSKINQLLPQGLALHQQGKLPQAQAIYEQVLQLQPTNFDALQLLGVLSTQKKDHLLAIEFYSKALQINPQHAASYNNLGVVFHEQERFDEAIELYERAIANEPKYADAHYNRGNALKELERYEEALASYEDSIALSPNHAESHFNKGNALKDLKRFEEALASYNKAISLKPNYADANINKGNVLQELGCLEEAVHNFNQAITVNPRSEKSWLGLGIALRELKQSEESLLAFDKAIQFKPDYAEAYCNKGLTLQNLRHFDEAVTCYDQAILLKPDYADAFCNKGACLSDLRKIEEGIACVERAIEIDPQHIHAHWNKSLFHLLSGNLKTGWQEYEWRWDMLEKEKKHTPRVFTQPLWLGKESIQGKTILLHAEQGLGDTLQFCRYASLVANLGATVILEVQAPLGKLLSNLEGVSQVVAPGEPLPQFDYQCPLLSLPLALKTEIDNIPALAKYLVSDEKKLAHWQSILGEKKLPRVGIVWSGNAGYGNDINRSISLNDLIDHLPDNCEYISLQKEIRDTDRQILNLDKKIRHFGGAFQDFLDTAALCDSMDLVISVDTSVAHLAGALGKPTWIMLPHNSDWRWLLEREDSPWYPSVKLYRKPTTGSWDAIMSRIQKDLKGIELKID